MIWDRGALAHYVTNPGFDIDLVANASIDVLVTVWIGSIGLAEATASGAMRFKKAAATRNIFVRMLDLRLAPCVKKLNYRPPQAVQPMTMVSSG